MTPIENLLINCLVRPGYYMLKSKNCAMRTVYKMYSGNQILERHFSERLVSKYGNVLKMDKRCRITLHGNLVRSLNGKRKIKVLYKKKPGSNEKKKRESLRLKKIDF